MLLLRELVDKLKPRYKTLVEMRYYQELSYEEIATQLNLPLGTVKAQLLGLGNFCTTFLKTHTKTYKIFIMTKDFSSIADYFPDLTSGQKARFTRLIDVYNFWNSQINVISRKDMDNFYLHHVLHSLAISKVIKFSPGSEILDVGTGGGFPGIPLAILCPDIKFHLVDSIGKNKSGE